MNFETVVVSLLLGLVTVLVFYIFQLRKEVTRMNELRWAERRGRTKAERRLRESAKSKRYLSDDSADGGVAFFPMRGIGVALTPFRDRRGTPRQGSLLNLPCEIQLHSWCQPQLTLDGIGDYSHVWVLFAFSENTNDYKVQRSAAKQLGCKARVTPPRMKDGSKVGIFATRAPHRPNPMGMTLVSLHSVDLKKGLLRVRGADFVNGTPVLDLKPYLPYADSVTGTVDCVRIAKWVADDCGVLRVDRVLWTDAAQSALRQLTSVKLRHFDNASDWKSAMAGILSFDIRSQNRRGLEFLSKDSHFECILDALRAVYTIDNEPKADGSKLTTVTVINVQIAAVTAE